MPLAHMYPVVRQACMIIVCKVQFFPARTMAKHSSVSRAVFLLWLVCAVPINAHRVTVRNDALVNIHRGQAAGTFSANRSLVTLGANATMESETEFLCFGLCIALGGGLIGSILGTAIGTTAVVGTVAFGTTAVVYALQENGCTNTTLSEVIKNASRIAIAEGSEAEAILDAESTEQRGAVSAVPWTPKDFLSHIRDTCGAFMEPKGLGESESSSKSGAVFWNCQTPSTSTPYGRVLVKGAIRNSADSPEWSVFKKLSPTLGSRYGKHTMLNRMLLGFDAFGTHWLVLEDVKATPVLRRLQLELGLVVLDTDEVHFRAYDIKPAGSRAPQLPECFHDLGMLADTMGSVKDFVGWDRLQSILASDLEYLDKFSIIDESLFVQVAGPFDVAVESVEDDGAEAILEVLLGGAPPCAFQIKSGKMAIICVSVLDYLLSLSFAKGVQNAFQGFRWNDYDAKMAGLLECMGDSSLDACADYRRQAAGEWQQMAIEQYEVMTQNVTIRDKIAAMESKYRCCCNTAETDGKLTMATACAWLRRTDQVTSWGYCPNDLNHFPIKEGGCMDLEPIVVPPEPKTRCGYFQSCCCYDRDYAPRDSPPTDLCSCSTSCKAGHHTYDTVGFCPQ
ncbi:unnamed protein product [Prorocentrum cordatum]|uniref:Uncharacterized protein n=1 Tax=Prorocentrum cordatum TaxID=2364126 RepID=A0ABN9VL93_9DINO|nr:unnamed protein product [Polarella glacialis]